MEVAETTTGQDVQKSSSSTSENVKEMSFEKTAHGTVQSQLQLQKSAEQSVEKSLNATKIQSVGVEKSHKSTESVSTSVVSSSQRKVTTSSSVIQSIKKIAEVVNGETDVSVSTTIKLAPKTEEVEEEEEEEEEEEIEEEEEEDEEEEEVVVVEAKKQTVITQSEAPVAQSNEASADTATKSVPEPAPALSTSSQETQNESKAVEKTEISSSAQESESIESIAKISPSEPANESVAETIKETRTQSTIVRQPTVEESKAVSEQPKEIIPAPQELSTEQKSPVEVSSVSNQTNEFPVTESFSQLRISEKPASTQTLEFEPSRPLTSSVAATVAAPSVAPPFAAPTVAPPVAAPMPAPPVSAFTPAAQPIVSSSQSQQIQQESIKKQLKEIVSDIDRAIEQQQQETVQAPQSIYSSGPVQSTLTSQSSTTTEIHKKTTTSSILSPPSYFYQEDTSSATPSSLTKPIDLQKIFTPASDAEEIVPQKNRKLYASSAFFTPGLHPTVEDQVELARRISSSLSDANNKLSKGQTMYVNRKKRSVKWVHEGEGKNEVSNQNGYGDYKSPLSQYTSSDEQSYSTHRYESKLPLKLVMDPRGIVQDVHNQGITYDHSSGMLSPDKCAELVSALHTDTPKGKGAELFAKRRKRSEKWIVDETTRSTSSPGATSYSAGPTQLYDTANQYGQSKLLDKQVSYQQPSWEVPYESTRREDSFRQNAYSSAPLSAVQPPYQPSAQSFSLPKQSMQPLKKLPNSQRDLAYKPSVPQGWNAPPPSLPNVGIENQSDNSDEMDTAKPQLTDNNDKKIINHRLDADSNEAIDAKMKSNHLYETNAIDYFIQTKESLRHVPQAHNESNGRVSQQKISDTQLSQNNDDDCGDDEHENYVKIPVQQLICTFEKQMRSVIKQKINENIQIKLENLIDSKTIKANSGKQTAMKTERDLSESLSETQSNIKSSIFTCETDTFVKNLNTTSDAVCNNFTQQQNHKFEGECVTSFNGLNQLPFEANNSSKQLNDNSPKTGDWSDNRFDLPLPVAESNTADVAESSAIETDDFHGEMFTPPEIPLSGYCPPQTDAYLPPSQTTHQRENYYQPPQQSLPHYQAPVSDLYASTRPVATAPAPPTYKKLQPSQIYSPSQTTPNLTPKPFTPSPISNEKLAIFEPAIQYQAPIIRRPLTIPNQVVRNVSPTPFGSRYGPTSATKTKSAAINISSQQHQSQQQPQAYSNDSFNAPDPYQCQPWQSYESTKRSQQTNRLSGCSFTSSSTGNYATMAPASSSSLAQSPRISLDVSAQENYNRAARGWGQTKDFYRPITFAKPHQVELPYSDF